MTVALALLGLAGTSTVQAAEFIRADSNANGVHDFTDNINTLEFLFLGTGIMPCRDAADTNDDGSVDFTDALAGLEFLFLGVGIIPPPTVCGSDPTPDAIGCDLFAACAPTSLTEQQRIGHLLNRIAYGPTISAIETVTNMGIDAYIQQQLDPESIPENPDLINELDLLTDERLPSIDTDIVPDGGIWKYWKGTQAPGAGWNNTGFDDSSWLTGGAPFGYDINNNYPLGTPLPDMNDPISGYDTLFIRRTFNLTDPGSIENLYILVNYDDGFAAYINGTMVHLVNVNNFSHTAVASGNHESAGPEEFDISDHLNVLRTGENVIAVHLKNQARTSSDAIIDLALVTREVTSQVPVIEYPTLEALKASLHLRGIYSTRRLQVVLADFWENHFTTDGDKLVDYFSELTNSDGNLAMTVGQAEREAATLEAQEYEFFLNNALGDFGDLLRFSAKSPTMLIYLDNILNFKANPNENYSREILELHSYGVENGYVQRDIEQGARIFTGWNVCKVAPENVANPHASCGVQFTDTILVDYGPIRYFKGTTNPTETGIDMPTIEWTELDFDDTAPGWISGFTSIGYGDGDDITRLSDMQNGYMSVFLRQEFTLNNIDAIENLILSVEYDDGFVAYINGVEVTRSESMEDKGTPPPYSLGADEHENEGAEPFNLNHARHLILEGETNVLAIQVHNRNLDSSDSSMGPRIVDRIIHPGSIENGDRNAVWAFNFQTDEHDYNAKLLFSGRPYQFTISSNSGTNPDNGIQEGDDFIDLLVDSAPTAEFICTKLVRKLVDDSAPPAIVAEAIAAWNSTMPKGNIATVVEAILTSDSFFNIAYYRNKVKDPLEFVNSTARVLDSVTDGFEVIDPMRDMGMHMFTRGDPDGWPEGGIDWSTAGGILNRILLAQDLGTNDDPDLVWQTQSFLNDAGISSAPEIVSFFNDLLFDGTLTGSQEQMITQFLETNDSHTPQALVPGLSTYTVRVGAAVSLMLSLPQWNFQ